MATKPKPEKKIELSKDSTIHPTQLVEIEGTGSGATKKGKKYVVTYILACTLEKKKFCKIIK